MHTKQHVVAFLVLLFISSWPVMLHADQPGRTPEQSSASSFLLVASKKMPDPRFQKSVIVVTRHGNTGPLGVIVNLTEDVTLEDIFPDNPAAKKIPLYYGGPVFPKQVSFLVRGGKAVKGSLPISKDTFLAYDMSALDELLHGKRKYKDLRVMRGLASWAPGQLEHEISQGGWHVMPLDEDVIFDHSSSGMWQELHNRANSIRL